MNIFITNTNPVQAAIEHCNVHLVKMVTEAAQLLSTAHHVLDRKVVGMKPTHHNHPCAVWARKTSGNYEWLFQHYMALCAEHRHRFGKKHGSEEYAKELLFFPKNIQQGGVTFFVKTMPDEYKRIIDVPAAYQTYLKAKFVEWQTRTDKRQMPVEWGNREIPKWMEM